MIVDILIVIALILLVISLCTLFTTNHKLILVNAVTNAALAVVLMVKNLIVGSYGWAGLFAVMFVLVIVFLFLALRVDDLLERDKFLNDIKKKYGSTRH